MNSVIVSPFAKRILPSVNSSAERRPTDMLNLRLQGVVATHFEYPQRTMLRRIEEFMRDYYLHSRNMFHHSNSVMQGLKLREAPRHLAAPLGQPLGEPLQVLRLDTLQ